jgi:hypothetical protein
MFCRLGMSLTLSMLKYFFYDQRHLIKDKNVYYMVPEPWYQQRTPFLVLIHLDFSKIRDLDVLIFKAMLIGKLRAIG